MLSRLGVKQTTNDETNHDPEENYANTGREIKELMGGEEDFLRPLVELVVQEVLEAEMIRRPRAALPLNLDISFSPQQPWPE
jgi:hypothetical protein